MNRERRIRRIAALKMVTESWKYKIAAVHSSVVPKTQSEEEKWKERFEEYERGRADEGDFDQDEDVLPPVDKPDPFMATPSAEKSMRESGEKSLSEWELIESAMPKEIGEPAEVTPFTGYMKKQRGSSDVGDISYRDLKKETKNWSTIEPVRLGDFYRGLDFYGWEDLDIKDLSGPKTKDNIERLVLNPFEANLEQKYLGAKSPKTNEWHPTTASLTLLWLSVMGKDGIERDPSKVIEIPENYPYKSELPTKIYGLTDRLENLVLEDIDNIWSTLEQVLPSLGYSQLNLTRGRFPLLRQTSVRFNPKYRHWEFSDTRHSNLAQRVKELRLSPQEIKLVDEVYSQIGSGDMFENHLKPLFENMGKPESMRDYLHGLVMQLIYQNKKIKDDKGRFRPDKLGIRGLSDEEAVSRFESIKDLVVEALMRKFKYDFDVSISEMVEEGRKKPEKKETELGDVL